MIRQGLAALLLLCALTGPAMAQPAAPAGQPEATARFGAGAVPLLMRSTTDIQIIGPTMQRFVEANPDLAITYEQWGSNELFALTMAGCQGEAPAADAVLSSAVHQMVYVVNAGCALRHQSPRTAALPPARRWRHELWGITEEPAVIIYNRRLIDAEEVPRSRFALLDLMRQAPGSLRGRIATYDITASGLGFLFAYSDSLEATTFGAMLEGFARTEAVATCCSAEIIHGVASGRYSIAYNVLGSYVEAAARPEVGVILPEDYTLFLSRGFLIPRHAPQPVAAARLLEYLVSPEGQASITEAGLIFPQDPAETGLLPSARRFITLAPPLLVALDQGKADRFRALWNRALAATPQP